MYVSRSPQPAWTGGFAVSRPRVGGRWLSVAPAASLLAPLVDYCPRGSVRFALYAEADGLATLTVWGF